MSDKKNFPLRLQQETFEALQKWADDEFRSLNGQIEFLLTQSLKKAGRDKPKKKSNQQEE